MKTIWKRMSVLLTLLLTLTMSFACSFGGAKKFSKAGATITLTNRFIEKEIVSQTAYFESTEMVVTLLKEEFTLFAGLKSWTLEKYAETTIAGNGLKAETVKTEKPYVYFEYEKTVSGNDYKYLATCHKADDAFWLIQFGCFSKNYDKLREDMFKYADSVTFGEEIATSEASAA